VSKTKISVLTGCVHNNEFYDLSITIMEMLQLTCNVIENIENTSSTQSLSLQSEIYYDSMCLRMNMYMNYMVNI